MNIKASLSEIKQKATSQRGRSVLTFLIFLLISTIFWFMMTLNETIQRDYRLQVEINDIPVGTTFITQPPQFINVSVKDKGRALIKYDWGTPPKVKIKYKEFIKTDDAHIVINHEMLSNSIRNVFGSGCEILSIRPDSINLVTTARKGEKLPILLNISATTEPQYIIYGNMRCSSDSVTIYSLHGIPSHLDDIETELVSLRNLTDTTTIEVALKCPVGTRIEPTKIKVEIPVEPLATKKRILQLQAINLPKDVKMHTFPSSVEISYLVPMSMFKNDNATPSAIVDFRTINPNSTTAHINITNKPDYYHNIDCNPNEVEYLIEQSIATETDSIYSINRMGDI